MLRRPKKGWTPEHWASWKPFGLGKQYPNNYWEVFREIWQSRDRLTYAWDVLNQGVCDGCALLPIASAKRLPIGWDFISLVVAQSMKLTTSPRKPCEQRAVSILIMPPGFVIRPAPQR